MLLRNYDKLLLQGSKGIHDFEAILRSDLNTNLHYIPFRYGSIELNCKSLKTYMLEILTTSDIMRCHAVVEHCSPGWSLHLLSPIGVIESAKNGSPTILSCEIPLLFFYYDSLVFQRL